MLLDNLSVCRSERFFFYFTCIDPIFDYRSLITYHLGFHLSSAICPDAVLTKGLSVCFDNVQNSYPGPDNVRNSCLSVLIMYETAVCLS